MRKNYYLTIDTEANMHRHAYNVGVVVHDRKGRIHYAAEYVVAEIFYNPIEVQSAYYADKIPSYYPKIDAGEIQVRTFRQLIEELQDVYNTFNITHLAAYNASYDIDALYKTAKHLGTVPETTKLEYLNSIFPDIKVIDIYAFAVDVLLNTNKYFSFVYNNIMGDTAVSKFLTDKGNLRTSAEVAYMFIKNDTEFEEEHTALADAIIESEILTECFNTHKPLCVDINANSWRKVQAPQKDFLNRLLSRPNVSAIDKMQLIESLPAVALA